MYFLSPEVNSSCTEGDVRLAGGGTVMEGRVEVCHNQTWWAVSGYSWDYWDAIVVCRQLHYPSNCKYPNNEYSSKTVWLKNSQYAKYLAIQQDQTGEQTCHATNDRTNEYCSENDCELHCMTW